MIASRLPQNKIIQFTSYFSNVMIYIIILN